MRIGNVLVCLSMALSIAVGVADAQAVKPSPCRPANDTGKPAIVCRIGGGLTGTVEEWWIYPDGMVCSGTGADPIRLRPMGLPVPVGQRWSYVVKGRMPPGKVTQLLDRITKQGFFRMASGRYAIGGCEQCRRYRVIVRKGTRKRTVEGADNEMPAGLGEVVSIIQETIAAEFP